MPEVAAAPVVPTPRTATTTTPAPAPGATTATPPAPPVDDMAAKYRALEADTAKRTREHVIERRKWESEGKTLRERAAKAAELEATHARAKTNPVAFLRATYGDNWQTIVNEAGLTGATPAQLVEESIAAVEAKWEAKDKARQEAAEKERATARTTESQQVRQGVFTQAMNFYREKASEFPILAKIQGGEPAVARAIMSRMESEFLKSHKVDDDGHVLTQGKLLTPAEAAELIEAEVLEWAQEAGKHEKYKAKLQPASPSGTVSPSKQQGTQSQPARRSLTNEITGSTSATKPPADERERLDRVNAAWTAARRKG